LRVEIDITLASGERSLEQAARALTDAVPMDQQTGREEATFFAGIRAKDCATSSANCRSTT
jgi:hypothetical protein